jgi:hypothetical protein
MLGSNGTIAVPKNYGIGVEVIGERVRKFTLKSTIVRL